MRSEGGEKWRAGSWSILSQVTSHSVIAILLRFGKSKTAPQARKAIILDGVGGGYLMFIRKRAK